MLVLSRHKSESIMLGDDIEIFIVDIRGDKVRVGIVAPKEIPVHRKEVKEAIDREALIAAMHYDSPEQRAYRKAKHRCYCKTAQNYDRYGGRGIQFLFSTFTEFIEDIGIRPSDDHSLDRIDNDGHYEKGNVRWATRIQQANNQSSNRIIKYAGKERVLTEWSLETGIGVKTLAYRLDAGWSVSDALTKPVEERNWLSAENARDIHLMKQNGQTSQAIADHFGVSRGTIYHVLSGHTFKEVYDAIQREKESD